MKIRRCTPEDTELVAKLGRETYYHTYKHLNTPSIMQAYLDEAFPHEKIRSELEDQNSHTFLLTIEEEVAAFSKVNILDSQTDLQEKEGMELQRIYVLEKYKRRGLGKTLIEHSIALGRELGCSYIWLSVWKKNPSAVSFYEKMGFHQAGTRIFKMGEELQSDYLLRREIS